MCRAFAYKCAINITISTWHLIVYSCSINTVICVPTYLISSDRGGGCCLKFTRLPDCLHAHSADAFIHVLAQEITLIIVESISYYIASDFRQDIRRRTCSEYINTHVELSIINCSSIKNSFRNACIYNSACMTRISL